MSRRFWALAILASVCLHLPLWLLYQDYLEKQKVAALAVPVFTSRILSTNELDRLMRKSRSSVESQAPKSSVKPSPNDEAKYFSEQTRRTDKETIARGRPGLPGLNTPAIAGKESPSYHEAASRKLRRLGMEANVALSAPESPEDVSKLNTPNTGMLRSPAGENGSVDVVLSDVAQGSETLLNTDEYVFSSFFNRLKNEVEPRWSPLARQIMKQQWRSLPEGIYVTELSFGTDDSGKITFVEVARSSGYAEFDKAASDSLWDLGRVMNLPRELLDRDSRYRTKLTFVVDFKKSGMRFDTITENEEK